MLLGVCLCVFSRAFLPCASQQRLLVNLVSHVISYSSIEPIASLPLEEFQQSLQQFSSTSSVVVFNQTNSENVIYSPLSLTLAMQLASLGARGQTQSQLASALRVSLDASIVSAAAQSLLNDLNAVEKDILSIQTALYTEESLGTEINQTFLSVAQTDFQSLTKPAPFIQDIKEAELIINNDIREATNGQIEQLVSNLPSNTRIILTNAIAVEAIWNDGNFSSGSMAFQIAQGNEIQVESLEKVVQVGLLDTSEALNVAIPLAKGSDNLFFGISMPKSTVSFGNIASSPAASLSAIQSILSSTEAQNRQSISLQFPKFSIRSEVNGKQLFQQLGVTTAFSPTDADFSGIAPDLFLESIPHKAVIQVDEKGVSAAAATAVVFGLKSSLQGAAQPVIVRFILYNPISNTQNQPKSHGILLHR